MSTKNYRIQVEAVPVDASRSVVHMSYAYGYGFAAKIAMQTYLSTIGSAKVGFTILDRKDGKPVYQAGVLGLLERNTMRYYLAIDAYLSAYSLPAGEQFEKPDPRVVREHRALRRPAPRDGAERVPRHEAEGNAPPAAGLAAPGRSGRRRRRRRYWTVIDLGRQAGVEEQLGGPGRPGDAERALFGSLLLANAPMLFIIASDSASRPAWFAVPVMMLPNSDGPKVPKMNGRSNTWAAP